MKYALFALALLLTTNTALASDAGSGRNFVINKSYKQVMEALDDPKSLEALLANRAVKVVSFNLNDIELEAEKDIKQKTQWTWHAKATANAHIIVSTQRGPLDLHLTGTLYRGDDKTWIDVHTTQTKGDVAYLSGRIEIHKVSENSTLLKLRVYIKARMPCFRCRLVRRIANNRVHSYLCGLVNNGLCKAEGRIRCQVEYYHRMKAK
jgi:hypothetical protein